MVSVRGVRSRSCDEYHGPSRPGGSGPTGRGDRRPLDLRRARRPHLPHGHRRQGPLRPRTRQRQRPLPTQPRPRPESSLRRLGVEAVDLYQAHAWDPLTPVEETLAFFDDAVRAGKVRYSGLSN
ncbi:aldo/keto reductase [Streptomyces sp. NRRL F-5123]|uniref:aldo/keto reductase n=1 Tax=Streptomyces sp. NRRL F-5123 TaxID=1463856 RepID=UPI0019016453